MKIDIQEIMNSKLEQLKADQIVEKAIETTLESSMIKAVVDALDGYKIKRQIQEKVEAEFSSVVSDLDFSTYNGFIAEKIKEIVEHTCREDLCQKIEKTFSDIFLCTTESIKLSDIFKKYREIVCNEVDERDKYDRGNFLAECVPESAYRWINCKLDEDPECNKFDCAIRFTVHKRDDGTGWIGSVYLDGSEIKDKLKFGYLNDVEIMLIQAAYNDIPIIIDIDDEDDIDNTYDINI